MTGDNKSVNIKYLAGNLNVGDSPEYQISSVVNELLVCLASKSSHFVRVDRAPSAETVEKIDHNNLRPKSHIIRQYIEHSSKIEEAYKEVDVSIPFGKSIILRNLNGFYFAALDELGIEHMYESVDVQKIREHSIYIIDFIVMRLRNFVYESKGLPILKESIELGVNVVVAQAFIECVIMENPNNVT